MSNTTRPQNQTSAVHAPTYRLLSALAATTGALWTIAITLIATQADTDPVGAGYDAANRVLTLPLILLVGYSGLLRRVPPGGSRRGVLAMLLGSVLLLAGNVLEFWVVLLTDLHTEKTALRLGEMQAFWGSPVGWMMFLARSLGHGGRRRRDGARGRRILWRSDDRTRCRRSGRHRVVGRVSAARRRRSARLRRLVDHAQCAELVWRESLTSSLLDPSRPQCCMSAKRE